MRIKASTEPRSYMRALIFLALAVHAWAQISVDIQIMPDPTIATAPTVNQSKLSVLPVPISSIVQTVDTSLVAEQCPRGTYSTTQVTNGVSAQICAPCPAGTASDVPGASSIASCLICVTGTYAAAASSVCTSCPANTFSVTQQAASAAACLACPNNTTSPIASDNIDKCVCNSGFFPSVNLLDALPYDAIPITLSLSGTASIDYAHVTC